MALQNRLVKSALASVVLIACLTGCSNTDDATPTPTPGQAPTAEAPSTPTPAPTESTKPDQQKLADEAKLIFEKLPSSDWVITNTDKGSSAVRENSLDISSLQTFVKQMQTEGWSFTETDKNDETFIGYLSKDDRIITVFAAVNPETDEPTTAVFYYSDEVWLGASTQS